MFATIAGAAIATALIVYNVNQGNSVNVSDMENSGLLSELGDDVEELLNGKPQPTILAGADSGSTAASAGVMGSEFIDDTSAQEDSSLVSSGNAGEDSKIVSPENTQTTEAAAAVDESQEASDTLDTVQNNDGINQTGAAAATTEQSDTIVYESVQEEVRSYVEAVPQTRTETVVDEKTVTVEKPVTVVEEITEEVEADPVFFYSETGNAAVSELTTSRRVQEAEAARQADMERLKAAEESDSTGDWKVPEEADYDDSFIVFN